MKPGILFVLLVGLSAPSSWGAVIEIYPGESFKDAVESLAPGDTLIVHEGTYSESGPRIRINAKGTQAQPLIVKGADGEARPLITRPPRSTPQNTINIEGASWVTISHLEITGNGDGIFMTDGPHHIFIENNEIHDIDVGVNFRSSMDSIFVRHNHIYNTAGTAEGMYVGCNDAACVVSNSVIEQNWIHDTAGSQGDGIEIKYGSYGNIIRDNVIHDCQYPCILAYGVEDAHVGSPNIIEGNVVWACGQGIDVIADATVRNNIVLDTLETQSHIQVPIMRNVVLVNNTVIGSMVIEGWGEGNDESSFVVANNVVYGGSISNQPGGATYSSNQEYTAGTGGIFVDEANLDYWPAPGSPLLGAADGAYTPGIDFNGTLRVGPFDVGAYETEGLARNPGWPIQDGFKTVPDVAGRVPDGGDLPGVPLELTKEPGGDVTLAWGASCQADDGEYAVYEGSIGDFSSHAAVLCGTGGETSATLTPGTGNTYYLVTPVDGLREGSLGADSAGNARPPAPVPCLPRSFGLCD